MWPIMPSSFPPTPRVNNRGLNVCKTSCDSSTHFTYFNSWQKVDGETSIVKFGHHSRTCLEGLTNFWSFGGSSAPPYSPFCTLRMHMFNPKPFLNPRTSSWWWQKDIMYCRMFYMFCWWKITRGVCSWIARVHLILSLLQQCGLLKFNICLPLPKKCICYCREMWRRLWSWMDWWSKPIWLLKEK